MSSPTCLDPKAIRDDNFNYLGTTTLRTQDRGCGYFMWKDDLGLRLSSFPGPSTPPSSSSGPSTRPSYSPEPSEFAPSHGKA
ncbi:hypothetical protein Tco_0833572 [Tanacetum coccineum]